MLLRDFIYEVSRQISSWFDPVDLSYVEAEKRERLVQTYLIVFGLLLSYDRDLALQRDVMMYFVAFLLESLYYYSMILRSFGCKFFRNIAAFGMAFTFSYAVVSCYVALAGFVGGVWCVMLLLSITTFLVAFPLFV